MVKKIAGYSGWVSVFVDAVRDTAPNSLGSILLAGKNRYASVLAEVAREVLQGYLGSFNPITGSLGTLVAKLIGDIASALIKKIGLWNVFIAVDDVKIFHEKAVGDAYLASLYRTMRVLRDEGAERVVILIATSDGESRKVLGRASVSAQRLLWNMDQDSFQELVNELGRLNKFQNWKRSIIKSSHEEVRRRCGNDVGCILWSYSGGNPRSLESLANENWNPRTWVKRLAAMRIRPLLDTGIVSPRSLIDDPDSDDHLADIMTQHNLMSPVTRDNALGIPPMKDYELGIGERWAWQYPALRLAAMEALGDRRQGGPRLGS